ncbi:hypothetical protein GCM10011358_24410 [Sinisalibacter lacisalsi]|uniref:Uncharacterized protein n=1 Tax=Sinisalibacter lacisalsi TaxID=1526570 RepID=A0ABQ1QS08_9RHOB|nr:hypothetical protein GCM10011358_24410 [Sinisalibacter lacisalsi]
MTDNDEVGFAIRLEPNGAAKATASMRSFGRVEIVVQNMSFRDHFLRNRTIGWVAMPAICTIASGRHCAGLRTLQVKKQECFRTVIYRLWSVERRRDDVLRVGIPFERHKQVRAAILAEVEKDLLATSL